MTATDEERDVALEQLSERESEILRRSGERVFDLSRRLAASERTVAELRQHNTTLQDLLVETRTSRDTLLAHTEALQRLLEREYDERAELRRLLAGLQMQMQGILGGRVTGAPSEAGVGLGLGRIAEQKTAAVAPPSPTAERRRRTTRDSWLRTAAREIQSLRRR